MGYRFKQTCYADWCLHDAKLLETLETQPRKLRDLARNMKHGETEDAIKVCRQLNFELLRFACQKMRQDLAEAAQVDCAQLVTDTVVNTDSVKDTEARWGNWLGTAPWWPQLAQENWETATHKAGAHLLARLESDGIRLDRETANQIEKRVQGLQIQDVLPAELYREHFPVAVPEPLEEDF